MQNNFFSVVSPFQIFRHVGHSETNTWIGASRVIQTVMSAENAKPGDEIHVLVGGSFLIRDGNAMPVSLQPSKPPLEKTHGLPSMPLDAMKRLANAGRVKSIDPADVRKPDYNAGRKSVEANRLPPLHLQVIATEKSPEYDFLVSVLTGPLTSLKAEGLEFRWTAQDTDAYGGPKSVFTLGEASISFYVYEDFRIRASAKGFSETVHNRITDFQQHEAIDGIEALFDEAVWPTSERKPGR